VRKHVTHLIRSLRADPSTTAQSKHKEGPKIQNLDKNTDRKAVKDKKT
jgi:hypothetical protein